MSRISNLPAQADADAILGGLSRFKRCPVRTFITHGEPAAACEVPSYLDEVLL